MATVKTASTTRIAGRKPPGRTGRRPAAGVAGAANRPATSGPAAPALDLQAFLNDFKLPGVDVRAIVDGRRADIKAVTLANKRAYEGMKALAKRQTEMLREAVAQWRAAVKDLTAMDGSDLAAQRTELAKQAIRKALANVRELAEVVAKSQTPARDPVRQRLRDNYSVRRQL